MDNETRDKIKEAAKRRGNCPKCNGIMRIRDGASFKDNYHFDIPYKVCACGYEYPVTKRTKREKW